MLRMDGVLSTKWLRSLLDDIRDIRGRREMLQKTYPNFRRKKGVSAIAPMGSERNEMVKEKGRRARELLPQQSVRSDPRGGSKVLRTSVEGPCMP